MYRLFRPRSSFSGVAPRKRSPASQIFSPAIVGCNARYFQREWSRRLEFLGILVAEFIVDVNCIVAVAFLLTSSARIGVTFGILRLLELETWLFFYRASDCHRSKGNVLIDVIDLMGQ